jgi:ferredoxin
MAIVVTDNCRLCRFTECVAVCPVACFHADEEMVYIDNDACIDCMACIPVCPVKAVMAEDDLAESQKHWVAINAERSKALPVIEEKQTPLPTAEGRRVELGYPA